MSTAGPSEFVERIHASGHGCVLSLTGGGSLAIPVLLTVPGASATMLEVAVPYSAAALAEWLGGKFDQACNDATSRMMAMASFERARRLSAADAMTLCGIGVTASLATNRPKRGPHRVHVAWQSAEATVSYSCEFVKDRRTREEEEAVAAELALHAVAEACGVSTGPACEPSAEEPVSRREQRAETEWTELLLGRRQSVSYRIEGSPQVVFSGAFNPLHAGHRRMGEIASDRCGAPAVMELSIANVDKPMLDFVEIETRLAGLKEYPVLLTRAATFVEKAAVVPGATFVVGADTLARIVDERYYGGSCERRDSAVGRLAALGCRFLVFGRSVDGRFLSPSEINLPSQLRGMCQEVPQSEFHDDISSTELRTET